jgi:alkaline phosphatase D
MQHSAAWGLLVGLVAAGCGDSGGAGAGTDDGTGSSSSVSGSAATTATTTATATSATTEATASSGASSATTSDGPIELGELAPCTLVTIPAGPGTDGAWAVEGVLGFDLPEPDGAGGFVWRAPVVMVATPVVLTNAAGGQYTATLSAATTPPTLAPGMALGCGPFAHGVASGDPQADGVILWTRLTDVSAGDVAVAVEVATTPDFAAPVFSGMVMATAAADHTVRAEVGGLAPATTYYYRFTAEGSGSAGAAVLERRSVVGRTRTAPSGAAERLRFAVVSCTSVYSGYFNGHRQIAARLDLDALLHVGDYVYETPDPDELVRLSDPLPADPVNLEQWRLLHAFHLADPDLRAARAAHPWVMLWDNHDVAGGAAANQWDGSVQAFREWNPVRAPADAERPEVIYRTVRFGDLLDVIVIDTLLFRDPADAPDNADKSILGDEQLAWLQAELAGSAADWRIVANQKPVAPILGLLQVLGGSTWNGYPDARDALFGYLRTAQIPDVMFLSGDAHITAVTDLVEAPADPAAYDPATGEGAVAVEFQPASMSRGNVDEFFPTQPQLPANLEADITRTDPHYRFLDTTRHGYGILDITAERIEATVHYLPILERSDEEIVGATLDVLRGANHWSR